MENIADELEQFVAERPKHGRDLLPKVRTAYEQTAANFFQGKVGTSAAKTTAALAPEMDALRSKTALEWARLHDVLRYCVELEDTAADLGAIRELATASSATNTRDTNTMNTTPTSTDNIKAQYQSKTAKGRPPAKTRQKG
ncbi:hypothetical protein HY994_03990 [Candidatus Micrarchaeota archaeon]|nr:hypothetical protein [Candidatus Micrarchaeota archaeon]